VALKGRDAEEEVRCAEYACEVLGGRLVEIIPYSVWGDDRRSVVVYEKVRETPEMYPRRPGKPQKRPLVRGL
ncbi:MAG: 16S rRNA (guanine(527)-N(7))-methyltransferase RsmG, partial [Thermacetogeniaceae bacterium]